ncbi:MAG: hypothetical protein Q8L47_04460 [bacterium]|nr:hypothetical protein [bacterium]
MKKYILVGILVASMALPLFAGAQSTAELQAMINSLMAQVRQLQAQLLAQQGGGTTSWCHTFEKNLGVGGRGSDVSALHRILIEKRFSISDSEQPQKDGEGDYGHIYGENTAAAVTGFQEKYRNEILTPNGLKNGTGYVGPSTRKKLNQLYGCGGVITPPRPYPTPTQSSIKVLSPNEGESWPIFSHQLIKWQAPSSIARVTISLNKLYSCNATPGIECTALYSERVLAIERIPNSGSYEWLIPGESLSVGRYEISVSNADNVSISDSSDTPFSIVTQ